MARCSRNTCRRWRPDIVVRLAKVGIHMDGAWYCSDACVEAAATARLLDARDRSTASRRPALRLGSVLLQQRGITTRQLTEALASQRSSGLRLGAELERLGHATRETILRGLSAQCGIRYLAAIDTAAVHAAPGQLSGDEIRALGVVPFRESGDDLFVACAAPLPRAALGALQALIGRTIEPFLVSDADLARLTDAYGLAAGARAETMTVRDVEEGASRIAAAAAEAGDVTVKEARLDPFTWVRIAANGRISTLLVPPYPEQWEEHKAWLAATTPH